MIVPPIEFSPLAPWADRLSIKGIENPGVYLLAHFASAPRGRANPLAKEIIYIGETCDNSLQGRWRNFERSAVEGKFGHSGGSTYHEKFGVNTSLLYAAALPVEVFDDNAYACFIRYVERKLIWEYVLRWHKLPICNRK